MEEEGVPKKNIILAAALAFGFYALWTMAVGKFYPARPAGPDGRQKSATPMRPSSEPASLASQQSGPAGAVAKSQEKPAPAAVEEIIFSAWGAGGKIALGAGAPITALNLLNLKTKGGKTPLLLPGSSFLATHVPDTSAVWRVLLVRENFVKLAIKTASESCEKEFEFFPGRPGFGVMRLACAADKKISLPVVFGLTAALPGEKNQPPKLFAGYSGKKGLIAEFPKKKQFEIPLVFEASHPLEALGSSSQYYLAFAGKMAGLSLASSVRHNAAQGGFEWDGVIETDKTIELPFFLGVKDDHAMKELALDNLLYGGLLGPLKRLVRQSLAFFYKITGNYGSAIILLTIAFQIILLPFTVKNLKFSVKMKELAPKIQLIQQKFKNDPQKMNAEMMQLYKTYGTNPLGGCLVMLLQMPIFIALYQALMDSYELNGAPFVLWIKNLAVHDPTYILPLVMGAAMFIQMKKSQAAATDPSQKMMLYLMPAMFFRRDWCFIGSRATS
ncbi:MAG: membrane protein insertase YidC [Elusimicrobia bacterium]|nr:membrane protein insertase YidC [Elusimicrobiota bacterium]